MTNGIDFFRDELPIHIAKIEAIDNVLKQSKNIFDIYDIAGDWRYEIKAGEKGSDWVNDVQNRKAYSFSTNAMMLYALHIATGRIKKGSLIADIQSTPLFFEKSDLKAKGTLIEKNINNILKEIKKLPTALTKSNTFGNNDPFSLSWLFEIIECDLKLSKVNTKEYREKREILRKINKYVSNVIAKVLKTNDYREILETDNSTLDHAFPLVRCLHLIKSIKDYNIKNSLLDDFLPESKKYLLNKVYKHIGAWGVENSHFDAAELVFAMEGIVLIDNMLGNYHDENLLSRFFEVVSESQHKNAYWRPLRPVITTKTGMALLPLSIEIACSLLRTCKLLELKSKVLYFDKNIGLFEKYVNWLYSRISKIKVDDKDYSGWHSEHVHDEDKIHPWETVHVILFLMHYKTIYEEYIGRLCLKVTNLSIKLNSKDKVDWTDKVLKEIEEFFVSPRINKSIVEYYSMLLYGPPGTGKSSIAKSIAAKLEWGIITVTPSDFIWEGPGQVESRAKNIFRALEHQRNVVVFFDEIDRLILDRDAGAYMMQEDMFQFMTPSMLVKINDLREKEKVLFIIATNYEERIDYAIKRKGRIDEKYLINPPNLFQRKKVLKGIGISEPDLTSLAIKTCFASYNELGKVTKTNIEAPTIRLSSYGNRFRENDNHEWQQEPFYEFLSLVLLKFEGIKIDKMEDIHAAFNKKDLKFIHDFFKRLSEDLDEKQIAETINRLCFDNSDQKKILLFLQSLKQMSFN